MLFQNIAQRATTKQYMYQLVLVPTGTLVPTGAPGPFELAGGPGTLVGGVATGVAGMVDTGVGVTDDTGVGGTGVTGTLVGVAGTGVAGTGVTGTTGVTTGLAGGATGCCGTTGITGKGGAFCTLTPIVTSMLYLGICTPCCVKTR